MRYLSIFLLSIFFFSCAKEEDASRVDKEVTFYPIYSTTSTRANEIVSFVDGDAVGIFVLDKSVNSTLKPTGNYADNKKYIWDSGKRVFVAADNNNLIFNSPDRKLEFYVYFPYYSQVSDATSLSHVISGSGREDDFLLGVNNDMNGAQNVPLSFKHLLSKVDVKYSSSENKENAQMSVSTYTDTKINLSTGSIATTANKRVEIPLEKLTFPDYLSFVGVVAPQIYKSGEKFGMLSYTGGASHPFSFPSDRTFASGELGEVSFMPKSKAYTFSVAPVNLSVGASDKTVYPLTVISQKDDAINGVNLPNTTVPVGYQLTENPNWVTVTGKNVIFSENRGIARDGVITFTQDESELLSSVAIQQAAGVITHNYTFTLAGGANSASWTGISASGDSRNYSITSNKQTIINGILESTESITYEPSDNADWITVSGSTITVPENRGASRAEVVTFTQAESGKVITITVQQSAAVMTYGDWNVSVSASPTTIAAAGGTSAISASASRDVFTNGVKTSTETATPGLAASGTGFSLSGMTLSASSNLGTARSCVVTASHGGVSNTCTVTQSAGVVTYGNWNVSVSASPTTIAAAGGTSAISASASRDVFTNGVKTSTETATPGLAASGTGFSLSGMTLSASSNLGAARSCVVTASHGGVSNTCTVTQSAGVVTYNYIFTLDGSASWTGVSASGDSRSYSITSNRQVIINGVHDRTENVGYSGSSNTGWISASGSTITVQENMNTTPRGGNATFTQAESGKTITVTILQLKKSSIDIN